MKRNLLQKYSFSLLIAVFSFGLAPTSFAQEAVSNGVQTDDDSSQSTMQKLGLGRFGDIFTPSQKSPFYQAWERTRVSVDGKIINNTFSITDGLNLGLHVDYQYSVEPAFIKNYHQRFDQYHIDLGLSKNILSDKLSAGLTVSANATFARIYDEKEKALKAPVYFLNRLPWTAEYALKYLNPGDVARVDLSFGVSAGGSSPNSLNASLSRNSQFIVDIYRMKDSFIRLRLIATRQAATASVNASLSPISHVASSLLQRITNHYVDIKPISTGFTRNVTDNTPMDTFMVDYVVNLQDPASIKAFQFVMLEIRNLEMFKTLNFQKDENYAGKELVKLVDPLEQLSALNQDRPVPQRGVSRIFKGQVSSTFLNIFAESKVRALISLWSAKQSTYNATATVRVYDPKEHLENMIYHTNTSIMSFDAIGNLFKGQSSQTLEALVKASVASDESSVPTSLSDLIFKTEIDDKSLSISQIGKFKRYLKFVSPMLFDKIDWSRFSDNQHKTNGYLHVSWVFRHEALKDLPHLSMNEIKDRVQTLVDSYPEPCDLELCSSSVGEAGNNSAVTQHTKLNMDSIVGNIFVLLNSADPKQKLMAFSNLRDQAWFKKIGPAFMISFLPPERLQDFLIMRVSGASTDNSTVQFRFGEDDHNSIYNELQYMMAVINDRSFDLRLQLDPRGQLQIYKLFEQNNSDSICEKCDSL